jgi:hypothetical protein
VKNKLMLLKNQKSNRSKRKIVSDNHIKNNSLVPNSIVIEPPTIKCFLLK